MKRYKRYLPMLLILILTLSISASFAWFIFNDKVNIQSNTNVSVKVGNYLDIKYKNSDGTWGDWGNEFYFTSNKLVDVSSNGKTFYYPRALDGNDQPMFPMEEITSENKEGYFLEFYFMIRSDANVNVYLSDDSYVRPAADVIDDEGNYPTKSLYGNFSSSNIAGAARVSISEVFEPETPDDDTVEVLKQIWVPNSKYELYYNNGYAYFNANGTRESSYGYVVNNYTDEELETGNIQRYNYQASDYYQRIVKVGDTLATNNMINGTNPIVSFDGTPSEKEIVVRIWIEGTDREANAAMNQGIIDYNIELIGVEKEQETTNDIYKLHDIVNGFYSNKLYYRKNDNSMVAVTSADQVQYSYNGIDWTNYSSTISDYYDPLNGVNSASYVYIRRKEKASTDFYTICRINLTTQTNTIMYTTVSAIDLVICGNQDGKLYYKYSSSQQASVGTGELLYSYDLTDWFEYDSDLGLPNYFAENSINDTTTVYIKETEESTVIYELDLVNRTTKIKYNDNCRNYSDINFITTNRVLYFIYSAKLKLPVNSNDEIYYRFEDETDWTLYSSSIPQHNIYHYEDTDNDPDTPMEPVGVPAQYVYIKDSSAEPVIYKIDLQTLVKTVYVPEVSD